MIREGQVKRIQREQEERKQLVYVGGVLNRSAHHAKKFPRYEKVFPAKRSRQTPEEMMATMQQWTQTIKAANKRRG